jgi:hypothetical protein
MDSIDLEPDYPRDDRFADDNRHFYGILSGVTMNLKIEENGLTERKCLEVHETGITFQTAVEDDTAKRDLPFDKIDNVLLSEDHEISFQSEMSIFKIGIQPEDEEHKQIIEKLIENIEST